MPPCAARRARRTIGATPHTRRQQQMADTYAPSATAYPIARAHVNSLDQYRERYERSLRDPEGFWSEAAERLTWFSRWQQVSRYDFVNAEIAWFEGATLNACYNCVDRHVEAGHGGDTAIIWEGKRPGRGFLDDLRRAAGAGAEVRQRAQGARRAQGRPRLHLPADGAGAGDRHAGLRPHRRGALHRVRRLLRRVAARPHQRFHLQAADHPGHRLPRSQGRHPDEGQRRPGGRRVPEHRAHRGGAAHRR